MSDYAQDLEFQVNKLQEYVNSHTGQGLSYLEIIAEYCETNKVEPEDIASLISPSMKELIESECIKKKLVKNSGPQETLESFF